MKLLKSILFICLFTTLLSSCVVNKINTAAPTDNIEARTAIKQVKLRGLVVIFPTEYKKERVLRSRAKISPSAQKSIDKLKSERKERWNLWLSEIKEYNFSKISIVPDSLLKTYITNPENVTSYNRNGEEVTVPLPNIYVLYKEYGGFDIKKDGEFIHNPFPNSVSPSKWASIRDFLGVQGKQKSINSFFSELNNQLLFYYHGPQ